MVICRLSAGEAVLARENRKENRKAGEG